MVAFVLSFDGNETLYSYRTWKYIDKTEVDIFQILAIFRNFRESLDLITGPDLSFNFHSSKTSILLHILFAVVKGVFLKDLGPMLMSDVDPLEASMHFEALC